MHIQKLSKCRSCELDAPECIRMLKKFLHGVNIEVASVVVVVVDVAVVVVLLVVVVVFLNIALSGGLLRLLKVKGQNYYLFGPILSDTF